MGAENARVIEALSTIAYLGRLDRSLVVLEDRLGQTISLLERLKSAAQGFCTSLWLDVLAPVDVFGLSTRLLQAPTCIMQWKESSVRVGALTVLTLVQGHFLTAEGLSDIKKGIPVDDHGEEVELDEIFPRFTYAASRVASFVDLDDFLELTDVDPEPEE